MTTCSDKYQAIVLHSDMCVCRMLLRSPPVALDLSIKMAINILK